MLETVRSAWKIKELREKIFFTIIMFVVFRLGSHVPVPGIDVAQLEGFFRGDSLFGFLNVIGGGALRNFTIFAMSITPYINASIIMQLLTVVIPRLEELAKEGEEGRKIMNRYVRYGTVVLALLQAVVMTFGLIRPAIINPTALSYITIITALTAGTAFLMWLGEQITEKGIGNGISLIIFAGIITSFPEGVALLYERIKVGQANIFGLLGMAVFSLFLVVFIIAITQGERRIPVQYSKRVVGRRMYGGQSTHIPLKVDQAGVIPVIFASSILMFPPTVAQFVNHPIAVRVADFLRWGTPVNVVLYFLLIIFFTYFYTAIQFNPVDVAQNIKKYGGFIPGLRPGRPTAEYIERIVSRITFVGALSLAFVATLPLLLQNITDLNLIFSGTALIIVVGVSLETVKQIESYLIMRHYQGFIK